MILSDTKPLRICHHMVFMVVFMCVSMIVGAQSDGCIIIRKNGVDVERTGQCVKRYPPCSTFKVAISLMGYESGILVDQYTPEWEFTEGYVDWLERWKQPHTPKLWLQNSCVWYSQIITKKLGEVEFQSYVDQLQYGNRDVSGDKGKNNGLTHSWLSSSLAISPEEQITFIENLSSNKLPISVNSQEATKQIMFVENLPQGWKLYGKTGNGSQLDAQGNKIEDRQIGWFVGFAQKGEDIITFVYMILDQEKQDTYASIRARAALKQKIQELL